MFTEETVRKIADLARVELTDDEARLFSTQIGDVLKYIEKLNSVQTSLVEPMVSAHEHSTPLRDDVAESSPGAAAMLAPAPEQLYEGFKVPQVLGGS